MLGQNAVSYQQINQFNADKVQLRRLEIQKTIAVVADLIQDILKGVEALEPRFISTFTQNNGRYEGLHVHSPYEFEVVLYLNQMGVFNFVDDGSIPGCAVLKLSDGRKRSMSLWVEFITASGYLSARKIRSRFQALVAQTIEKQPFNDKCQLMGDTTDVKLLLYGKYMVQITCAFRCNGIWPRSASHWPNPTIQWPSPELAKDVRIEGFDLLSKEITPSTSSNTTSVNVPVVQSTGGTGTTGKPNTASPSSTISNPTTNSTMEGDAWAMSMGNAERVLLSHLNRAKALSILKTLRDRHLDYPGTATSNYLLKTLVLWECEKHCSDQQWHDFCLSDRIIGVLIQLISCLQCRKCPHYFLPQLDLLKGKSTQSLDESARAAWSLVRQLLLNAKALERL